MADVKKPLVIIILTLSLSALLAVFMRSSRLEQAIHWKIYEKLLKAEMYLGSPPAAIRDITLVTIDNQTLSRLNKRWPLPRSEFARAIDNLRKAGAKAIAFDFVFLGESAAQEEDARLKEAIESANVIMATAINENGMVELYSLPDLTVNISTGFTTKLQDRDGVTRRNLTYLINERKPTEGLLSWEMQVLRTVADIDISTLKTKKAFVYFNSRAGKRWKIPVSKDTNSFLIHFRANTVSFQRLPFYQAAEGGFDESAVKGKIILIGPASTLLGDMHLTPIGWLPGITLNANALFCLYTHDFIREAPYWLQWILFVLGIVLAGLAVSRLRDFSGDLFVFMLVLIFFILSFLLLKCGITWNYAFFPALVFVSPLWARRLYKAITHKK